ncbi:cellulose synthase [Oryzicola mucosus]|uniref:Cellulose synthase n=1 Tax=Oryzicola mucosus TaxID=2767425 RepID=A0A8J6PY79_9HYPH|nr:cellulose synthase [Oryzicola mucosus]MBD0416588.1 cellulose synthase [Oryzicola mucosus]
MNARALLFGASALALTASGIYATGKIGDWSSLLAGNGVFAAQAQTVAPTNEKPKVDETALRYFARQGDQKRLDAEIARLRALYPDWIPPEDPLALPQQSDQSLDAMWKLYSEGKFAEVRKAIAERQTADATWQPPADLLDRLAVAEAREQIINASTIKQYDTVVRVASTNPSLLTCGDIDVLWRVAEAFAQSDRKDRAKDAYGYILRNCTNPEERLATVQKAMPLLPRSDLNTLFELERKAPDGTGEFAVLRDDLARQSVAAADADSELVIPQSDIDTVTRLAREEKLASDALALGWYYVRRDEPQQAEEWFRAAQAAEDSATAAQGLALALIDQNRPSEAEAVLYKWRDTNDDTKAVYMAAVSNLLAVVPPVPIRSEVLSRMVPEIVKSKDAAAAQQLGWYADGFNQFETASQWFATALSWKSDDEPSAYGLTLMRWKLDNQIGVAEMQQQWAGQSQRIARVGQPDLQRPEGQRGTVPMATYGPDQIVAATPGQPYTQPAYTQPAQTQVAPMQPAQPAPREIVRQGQPAAGPAPVAQAQPHGQVIAPAQRVAASQPVQRVAASQAPAQRNAGCSTTIDPSVLSAQSALNRGWCLMELNRPLEAADSFQVALRSLTGQAREDAAYGQSLAYLRLGLSDKAAVAAAKAPQQKARSVELNTALLTAQATGAFEQGRWTETIMALDQRAKIAPERMDLMVLRGYAFLKLRRFNDAERIFRAAAGTGNRDAQRGLAAVKDAREGGVN